MTYLDQTGQVNALHVPVGAAEQQRMRAGTLARFTATGADTDGRFGLFEWHMSPRSGGPGAHFHRTFSESFYVLSGTVRHFDGANWTDSRPGDFLHVPEGGIHAFRNDSDEPASMLILFAPGIARERYFRELAQIAATGQTLSTDEWTELFARHDQYRA